MLCFTQSLYSKSLFEDFAIKSISQRFTCCEVNNELIWMDLYDGQMAFITALEQDELSILQQFTIVQNHLLDIISQELIKEFRTVLAELNAINNHKSKNYLNAAQALYEEIVGYIAALPTIGHLNNKSRIEVQLNQFKDDLWLIVPSLYNKKESLEYINAGKLTWHGPVNSLFTLFHDLKHVLKTRKNEAWLQANDKVIAKFLVDNFQTPDGEPLSLATAITVLDKSREDKKAKKNRITPSMTDE